MKEKFIENGIENFKIGFRLGVLMMCDSLLFDNSFILKDINSIIAQKWHHLYKTGYTTF